MMNSKIIIPSSGTIDMYDDAPVPITYSIANIKEPDKRNSTYTKTITIPGTKNNNQIFENIFDVNVSLRVFDPNKKIYCILLVDDIAVLTGYMQLGNIKVTDSSDVEYEIYILGQTGNPFYEMGNAELTDLDFSEFDHVYNYDTQVASWTNTWEQGYCYPLIDYGFDSDTSKVDVEHLQPAIFVKQYIKKIFESIGRTYTSEFLDNSYPLNLIVPSNVQNIVYSPEQIAERLFNYTQTIPSSGTNVVSPSSLGVSFDIKFDNVVSDPSIQYNSTTGEWTVFKQGHYNLTGQTTFTLGSTCAATFLEIGVWFELQPVGGSYAWITGETLNPAVSTTISTSFSNVYLNVGDKIRFKGVANVSPLTPNGCVITASTNGGFIKNQFVNSGLIEGDTLPLNNAIPVKIKQKDFLLSIIKMFNLYVDIDPMNPKNLIIEPRDDYYEGADIVDWTYKLDHNVPIDSKPMGALDFKEILWNYTDDTDYYNKLYKDKFKETYGLKRYVTSNEFQTNINETKVIFSPTPLVNDLTNDRIISVIWNVDNSNNVTHKSFNIRIIYNGGVRTTAYAYDYSGRYSGSHIQNEYLYAGHLDDPQSPSFDLSFGVPREIFYDTEIYTNRNLFNLYFANQLAQITDINSRIVTANFRLRPSDINNLSFRNKFYFEGQLFFLNEIKDYDPLSNETVQCTFLKLVTPAPVEFSQTSLNGGFVFNWEGGYPTIV